MTILVNNRKPDVAFYKNGRIDICAKVAKQLNLEHGDIISLAQDNGEVYLFIANKHSETNSARCTGRCFPSRKHSLNFRSQSTALCKAILNLCNTPSAALLPAGTPVAIPSLGVAIPLITRNNLALN
ncbi:MAG: hypothetical protein HDT08_04230 [Bacteroidales bacterium]|nr:hypothetical protein [Bacteroidales bacterium]